MHATRSVLLLAPVALLLTACNATGPKASQRINLSATIGSAAQASLSGPARDVIVVGSGGSVRITSAQVTLSHIKLANDAACSSTTDDDTNTASGATDTNEGPDANEPDDNNDDHDCEPVRVDPLVVNLPLDGTTKVVLDALVPAGTYTGVRAKFEGVNVVGVFTDANGADHPFTFTSDAEAELSLDFAAPVTVDASTTNLTVDVNVASWFTDASGAVIDPTNAANQEAIEHAIRASLRAFEDDNHDGNDDHEEEHAGS